MIAAGIDFLEYESIPKNGISSTPVIFLHGIGGSASSFKPQLNEFSTNKTAKHRAIAWNMPGYGASEAVSWPPSFESLSNTLTNFLQALSIERAHLVGQSIGGMLALEHVVQRPDQVKTLTLIAATPSFGNRDGSFKEEFLKARLAPLHAGLSMSEIAKKAAPKLVGPTADNQCITDIETILAEVNETTWRGILECLVTFDRRANLPSITKPCCVIAGGYDMNSPAKTLAKMADTLGNAEYHLIETAGHMINQEAPIETNEILLDFLQRHTA